MIWKKSEEKNTIIIAPIRFRIYQRNLEIWHSFYTGWYNPTERNPQWVLHWLVQPHRKESPMISTLVGTTPQKGISNDFYTGWYNPTERDPQWFLHWLEQPHRKGSPMISALVGTTPQKGTPQWVLHWLVQPHRKGTSMISTLVGTTP
jgi:hypothetical protein